MATTALTPGPVARGFLRLSGRLVVLLLLAVVLGVATYVTEERLVVIGLSSASATLLKSARTSDRSRAWRSCARATSPPPS